VAGEGGADREQGGDGEAGEMRFHESRPVSNASFLDTP